MILIGSRALAFYGLKRKCVDWDFIGSRYELDALKLSANHWIDKGHSTILMIKKEIVEFTLIDTSSSDHFIEAMPGFEFHAAGGMRYSIANLDSMLAIKQATADHFNREKHFSDINWIHSTYPELKQNDILYRIRTEEIKKRVEESKHTKFNFFHKYHDVEHIEHDKLHDMISERLFGTIPTYQLFVNQETKISEEHWRKLSPTLKLQRFTEEALVLTLERWFVPKLLDKGIYNPNTEKKFVLMAGVLAEHTIRGLKDEPEFMREFGQANREAILQNVKIYAHELLRKGFPKWFYNTLLEIRLK